MGLRDVKSKVIQCIEEGSYDHEVRQNIDVKNIFQCGQMTDDELIVLIKATKGDQHSVSPHHKAPSIDVHIFKPSWNGKKWYIKFYFVEPDVMFISVHEDGV